MGHAVMSQPARVLPEAKLDLLEIKAWYENQRKGLSKRFGQEFREMLRHIGRVPRGGTGVEPGVRKVTLRKFPYPVYYTVDDDDSATVLSVYHTSRDPAGWRWRLDNDSLEFERD